MCSYVGVKVKGGIFCFTTGKLQDFVTDTGVYLIIKTHTIDQLIIKIQFVQYQEYIYQKDKYNHYV